MEAWYTVQWTVYHATLFTEQCTNLWIESRARKHYFVAFHLLAFRTQFMVGPCTVHRFFFVNQTFASCVFDKTQTLTRSQTYYVTRFFIGIYMGHTSSLWHVDTLSWWTLNDYSSIIAIDNTHLFSMYEKYIFYFFEFLLAYYLIKPN